MIEICVVALKYNWLLTLFAEKSNCSVEKRNGAKIGDRAPPSLALLQLHLCQAGNWLKSRVRREVTLATLETKYFLSIKTFSQFYRWTQFD